MLSQHAVGFLGLGAVQLVRFPFGGRPVFLRTAMWMIATVGVKRDRNCNFPDGTIIGFGIFRVVVSGLTLVLRVEPTRPAAIRPTIRHLPILSMSFSIHQLAPGDKANICTMQFVPSCKCHLLVRVIELLRTLQQTTVFPRHD